MTDEKIGSFTRIWLKKVGSTVEAKPLLVTKLVNDKKNWRGFNSDIKWVSLPRSDYHKSVPPKEKVVEETT